MLIILGDIAGSGASMQRAIRGGGRPAVAGICSPSVDFQGKIVAAPILGTTDAEQRFTVRDNTLHPSNVQLVDQIDDGEVFYRPFRSVPTTESSAFFRSLSEEQRESALDLMGPEHGYGGNALLMAFPYMAPNNNNRFFVDVLARHFVLNRNQGAVKEPGE
ncbi:MAG: hypothetical protein KTR31_34425 [Myxococcales bacterium]|nr:hypothetical protein [Myxococcales bacterium]